MARVACTQCTREFKTENGLAFHVSREHADAGVRGNGDGNAEDQRTHMGLAPGEVASAVPEMTVAALADRLAEIDTSIRTVAESLGGVQDEVTNLSARFEQLERRIARHSNDHTTEDSARRSEMGDLRDQIQGVSVLVYDLDSDRRKASGTIFGQLLRLPHTPDVAQLNQARQTVERAVR